MISLYVDNGIKIKTIPLKDFSKHKSQGDEQRYYLGFRGIEDDFEPIPIYHGDIKDIKSLIRVCKEWDKRDYQIFSVMWRCLRNEGMVTGYITSADTDILKEVKRSDWHLLQEDLSADDIARDLFYIIYPDCEDNKDIDLLFPFGEWLDYRMNHRDVFYDIPTGYVLYREV